MTDLTALLSRHATQKAALAATEAAIRHAEREYWTARGYSVMPRRERLLAALAEDAKAPTPLEAWLESTR
jgi:hypothetical protein